MTREVDGLIAYNVSGNTGCYAGYTTNGKHADDSYHERKGTPSPSGPIGLAVDFDADSNAAKLLACAQYFGMVGSQLAELIHAPMGWGIKDGKVVDIKKFYGLKTYNAHFDHVHAAVKMGTFLVPAHVSAPPAPITSEDEVAQYEFADGAIVSVNSKGEVFCPEITGRPTAKYRGGITQLRDDAKLGFITATAIVGIDRNNSQGGYRVFDQRWIPDGFTFDESAKKFFK